MNINTELIYCPCCGSRLLKLVNNSDNNIAYLCRKTNCRILIRNSKISQMSLEGFSKLSDKVSEVTTDDISGYMLLNEKRTGPLFVKNSNNYDERGKDTYCIVKANSIQDAITKFKRKYTYININEDNVIPVLIKEI